MSLPIRRIVITGGPYSGKTTVIDALGEVGHSVVREAAIQVIDDLSSELGLEGQATWRKSNPEAFQVKIIDKQEELEDAAAKSAQTGLVFLDRGRLDGVAYCRVYERPIPPEVEEGCRDLPYDCVFLLDTLSQFDGRAESGRTSDRARSLVIRAQLARVYRERGFDVVDVEEMPVEERVEFILESLR